MKEAFKKLKPPTKKWVKSIQEKWELDTHHDRLLVLAAQAWDRATEAASIVNTEGCVIRDRFDQKKAHPAIDVERQSMITFSRLLRELGLDLVDGPDNRPPTRPGGY